MGNPIIPGRGICDPHVHIFGDRAFLYASHDQSPRNDRFVMEDWEVWSSADLVEWRHEGTIRPEETYLGVAFDGCWATDAAEPDGKFFFYFSERNRRAGVMVGDSPAGPWRDPLGRPLLDDGIAPTHPYDICVFVDHDRTPYIVFGVWDYYIARLGEDMVSLAEKPRRIVIHDAWGPYGPGRTDDKPSLHRHGENYYLSWGCFYAMGDSPYGPFHYRGCLLHDASFHDGTMAPTWPHGYRQGRHGSFFTWHGQSYFAYCDISQTGNRYFRDTFISHVHYRADGTMAPVRVDLTGVGRHDPARGPVQAEDFFALNGGVKVELPQGGFGVMATASCCTLFFPQVSDLGQQGSLTLTYMAWTRESRPVRIEVLFSPAADAPPAATVMLPAVPFHQTATMPVAIAPPACATSLMIRVVDAEGVVVLDALSLSRLPVDRLSPPRLFISS